MRNKMGTLIFALTLLLGSVQFTCQSPVQEDLSPERCSRTALEVQSICVGFRSTIKTLLEFVQFNEAYRELNACLHVSKPQEVVRKAEEVCLNSGLPLASLLPLFQLIEEFSQGEKVCSMEFSSRIYQLHERLSHMELDERSPQKSALIALSEAVMSRCLASLPDRLLEVEQRTRPDSSSMSLVTKSNFIVLRLLNVDLEQLKKLSIEGTEYNPITEDELSTQDVQKISIGFNPSGYEFHLSETLRNIMDVVKASCNALRPYHNNLLGSLGLLSSLQYRPLSSPVHPQSADQKDRIIMWTVSALLCQSLRTTVKLGTTTVENKHFVTVKVLNTQSPDITREDQFASISEWNLDELKHGVDPWTELKDIQVFGSNQLQRDYHKVNQNRFLFILGPSFKLADTIHAFLDTGHKPDRRIEIVYNLLGREPPNNQPAGQDDQNDDGADRDE